MGDTTDHLLEAADKAVEGVVDVAGVAKLHEYTASELGINIETIQALLTELKQLAPVVEFCFLGLRHINELAVPNVINSQLTSLLRNHYSAITCIVQTVDMVVVQQTGIVGLRMFIGFEEVAVISVQASRCAHPNKAAAVLQQIANIVVG